MSKESDNAPLCMALLFSTKVLVEYRANFVSDFDLVESCFGEGSFYYYFGVHEICLVKSLISLRVSPMRKRVLALESKLVTLCSKTKARL
jgi:hypothetical protein